MLVEKPFGIGYTLNLANWRSWIVSGSPAGSTINRRSRAGTADGGDDDDGTRATNRSK